MNKFYRLIWNAALNAWVVASEFAKSHRKGGSRGAQVASAAAAVVLAIAGGDAGAYMVDPSDPNNLTNVGTAATDGGQKNNTAFGSGASATATYPTDGSSTAIGYNTTASGTGTTAVGVSASASGGYSTAVGQNVTASGQYETVVGTQLTATGDRSVTIGSGLTNSGVASVLIGYQSGIDNLSDNAIAMGTGANVTQSTYGVAIGYGSSASNGAGATAVGDRAAANGTGATAYGYNAKAFLSVDTAVGNGANANGGGAVAVGNVANAAGSNALALGGGSSASMANATAVGPYSKAFGVQSTAVGREAKAVGDASVAMGYQATAQTGGSIAIGRNTNQATTAGYFDQITIGSLSYAGGNRAVALGYGAKVVDGVDDGVAIGSKSVASTPYGVTGYAPAGATAAQQAAIQATKGSLGALSVGDTYSATKQYRQITGVAAGTLDSDAVNVAQLKAGQTHYYSVKDNGMVGSNYDNNGATGSGTLAAGYSSAASGTQATAVGYKTNSSGDSSVAVGSRNLAAADGAIAIGSQTNATAANTVAIGTFAQVDNAYGVAIGYQAASSTGSAGVAVGDQSKATGTGAAALGYGAKANGDNSTALGAGTNATEYSTAVGISSVAQQYSLAAGYFASATGNNSAALGYRANALGDFSVALGTHANASAADSVALGRYAVANTAAGVAGYDPATKAATPQTSMAWKSTLGAVSLGDTANFRTRQITGVAAGALDTDAVNVAQLKALPITHYYSVNDNGTVGANYNNDGATGVNALAAGVGAASSGRSGVAVGEASKASNTDAIAMGHNATAASANSGHSDMIAIGLNAKATNDHALAIGTSAVAQNANSAAVGANATASGDAASGFGHNATASGSSSTALGLNATASKGSAVALGNGSNAAGDNSAAIGYQAATSATNSLAIGNSAKAQTGAFNSIAIGSSAVASTGAINGVALGNNATASINDGIALGSGSVANTAAGVAGYDPLIKLASTNTSAIWKSTLGAVSVGDVVNGKTRQINGLAAGTQATDAVNVAQLSAVSDQAVKYDLNGDGTVNYNSVTLGGDTYNTITKTGGTRIKNVAAGVDGGDAVNVDQLTEMGDGLTAKGLDFAGNEGGNVHRDLGTTLAITGEASTAGDYSGANLKTVTDPLTGAIQLQMAESPKFGNITINADGSGKITGVTAGTDATDAVNVSQLSAATVDAVMYDDSTHNSVTLGGDTYNTISKTGGTRIKNVAAGVDGGDAVNVDQLNAQGAELTAKGLTFAGNEGLDVHRDLGETLAITGEASTTGSYSGANLKTVTDPLTGAIQLQMAESPKFGNVTVNADGSGRITGVTAGTDGTDAVNVDQLNETNANVTNIYENGTKYFHANSTGTDSVASGVDSVAIGMGAVSSHDGSVALGAGSVADGSTLSHEAYLVGGTATGEVSIGERRITGLSAGADDTDAVNVAQLKAITSASVADAVMYDDSTHNSVTLGGDTYNTITKTGGTRIRNVAAGVDGGDAVNVDQLNAQGDELTAKGLDFAGNEGSNVHRDLGTTLAITGEASTAGSYSGANLKTVTDPLTGTIQLQMAESPKFGNIIINAEGSGKITNVTNGEVSETSTDAVNGSQLFALGSQITNITNGGGIKYFHANSTKDDSSASGANSVAAGPAAVASGAGSVAMGDEAKATADQATAVGANASASGAGASAFGNNATAEGNGSLAMGDGAKATKEKSSAIGSGAQATARNAVALGADSIADREDSVSVGSKGKERQITNVKAGVEDTDAVNVAQLKGVSGAVSNLDNRVTQVDSRVTKVEGDVSNIQNGTDGMFQVNNTSNLPKPKPTGRDAVAGGAGAEASGANGVAIGTKSKAAGENSVAMGNGASASARNSVAVGANSVADRDNSVSVGSAGNERQITHLAAGRADTDAVNVGQLTRSLADVTNNANSYTDSRYAQLKNDLNKQDDVLSAGIAGALAQASLPQPYSPGASMAAAGVGNYRGQSSLAVGVSRISDNGKWVTKLQGNADTQGEVGVSVGVGYQW